VGGDRWEPSADVYETDDAVVIRFELAGVERDQIQITLDGNRLRVRGVRRPRIDRQARLHQVEIAFGPFERVLQIESAFDRAAVSATLEGGVLSVTLPRPKPRSHRIEVAGDSS